jgi:hypothetical protein
MAKYKREKKISDTVIAYRTIFDSDSGIRVLHDLIKTCHVLQPTMDPNPYEMAYKEGERSVVLRILKTLETDPARILELIKQGNQLEEAYE